MTASCPKTSPQTTAQAQGAAAAVAKQHKARKRWGNMKKVAPTDMLNRGGVPKVSDA